MNESVKVGKDIINGKTREDGKENRSYAVKSKKYTISTVRLQLYWLSN
jgi:hypothetical protein